MPIPPYLRPDVSDYSQLYSGQIDAALDNGRDVIVQVSSSYAGPDPMAIFGMALAGSTMCGILYLAKKNSGYIKDMFYPPGREDESESDALWRRDRKDWKEKRKRQRKWTDALGKSRKYDIFRFFK